MTFNIGINMSIGSGSPSSFNPIAFPDAIAYWDPANVSSINFQTGTGLGGTVESIDNIINAGTYDLNSYATAGSGSNYPAYLSGTLSHPAISNLDNAETGLLTSEAVFNNSTPRTFIMASTMRQDGVTTFLGGGSASTATVYVNSANTLRYSDIEGNGDLDIETNVNIAFGLIVQIIVFNSASDCDFYINSAGNVSAFDPKAAATEFVPMGRYSGGSGTGKQDFYGGAIIDRAITTDEVTEWMDFYAGKLVANTAKYGVVLAGQSNSTGYYTLTGAPRFETETKMKVWNYEDTLVAYDFTEAVAEYSGTSYPVFDDASARYSMGPAMMDYVSRRVLGDVVAIPCNDGGTQLIDGTEWGQRTTDFDTATLFGAMNTRVKAAIDSGISIVGVAWQQGEADANSAVAATQAEYNTALDALVTDFRAADGGFANIPWSIGVISDDCPDPPHTSLAAVQAAQVAFSKTNVSLADTSDGTAFPTSVDNVHYNAVGLDAAGVLHGGNFV